MGALCCCFHVHDAPDDNASNNSSSNDCSCPKCFFHKLLNKQRSQLNGGQQIRTGQQTRTVSPPNHQASSSNAEVIFDASSRHSGAAHNRDAPDNDSTRLLQEQSRQEKAINRSRVQPEPVGQSRIQMNPKSTQGDKIVVSTSEVETQEKNSQSSEEVEYSFLSLHEVEECPTCLEEYTEENPKIIAKCSHNFHLSCIYEWMERSQECPVCRELMLFDE